MSASTVSIPGQISTDAEFRTWAQGISNALLAAGWVKTSDTGQIDLTTVAKPTTTQTAAGYEIWRMSDALQATVPVFLKVEYGTYTSNTYQSLWFTAGSSTNGAGTVTGALVSPRRQTASFQAVASALNSHYSGATDRFGLLLNANGGTNSVSWFMIERTKDVSGNNTSDGIVITAYPAGGSSTEQVILQTGGQQTTETALYGFALPASGVSGLDINLAPVFSFAPTKGLFGPKLAQVLYWTADIAASTIFSTTISGSVHTYVTVGATNLGIARGANATSMSLAMRYE